MVRVTRFLFRAFQLLLIYVARLAGLDPGTIATAHGPNLRRFKAFIRPTT